MEEFKRRLKRYADEPATETFGWMNMMLQNNHASELARARENKLYLCVYLLAHSIIQMVSETMFGFTGLDGTKFFLARFADGPTEDKKFSTISSEIHNVRNVIAHRGYSKIQHEGDYFADDISDGWRREKDGSLTINPALYSVQVEGVFRHPTLYKAFCGQSDLRRLQMKYRFIRRWLGLDKDDAIAKAIARLDGLNDSANMEVEAAEISKQICQRYEL